MHLIMDRGPVALALAIYHHLYFLKLFFRYARQTVVVAESDADASESLLARLTRLVRTSSNHNAHMNNVVGCFPGGHIGKNTNALDSQTKRVGKRCGFASDRSRESNC